MSPFWNHILGLIHIEIAKTVETWKLAKLAKRNCIHVGIWTRDQYRARNCRGHHPPPPPPPAVAILFIYQTMIGYIRIHTLCRMYEFIGHRWYEFILFECMNSYLAARCVRCHHHFGSTSHINSAYHYCPDQLECVRLPRTVRVRSAAPIS